MKRYTVVISQTAEKELNKFPARTIEKIIGVLNRWKKIHGLQVVKS